MRWLAEGILSVPALSRNSIKHDYIDKEPGEMYRA